MKSFILIISVLFTFSFSAQGSTCKTLDGFEYQCNDSVDMLETIIQNVSVSKNTAYVYNGRDKVLRHIIRYNTVRKTSESYFQDYIYNVSGGFFHLVHFIKTGESKYDVYLETDIQPTGKLSSDIKHVSRQVEYLGSSTDLSFDQDGYPSATIKTATDTRKLVSSKSGLSFSVVGSFSEAYDFVYTL